MKITFDALRTKIQATGIRLTSKRFINSERCLCPLSLMLYKTDEMMAVSEAIDAVANDRYAEGFVDGFDSRESRFNGLPEYDEGFSDGVSVRGSCISEGLL